MIPMNDLFARESISEDSSSSRECYLCQDYLIDPHTLFCSHQACKTCIVSSIRNSVSEGRCPVPCFEPGCTGRISANECNKLLKEDLERCLKKIARLGEIARIPEGRRGSCPACQKVYDKHDFPLRSVSGRCGRCGYSFCPRSVPLQN